MRRILLITLGMTPALVTETVYALLAQDPPWVPDEIHLATTKAGQAACALLSEEDGPLAALYAHFELSQHRVKPEFHAVESAADGAGDIRSTDEVSAFAELLLPLVRRITADPNNRLHFSIAGGRKTMSFVAGQIMNLFARPVDVMSHCLVWPESVERSRDPIFWYPGCSDEPGFADARVHLHQVGIFYLRAMLTDADLFGDEVPSYATLIGRANNSINASKIELDFDCREVRIGNRAQQFGAHKQFAAIATILLAGRMELSITAEGKTPERQFMLAGERAHFSRLFRTAEFLHDLPRHVNGGAIGDPVGWRPELEQFITEGGPVTEEEFTQNVSRLRRVLNRQFGRICAERIWLPLRGQWQTGFAPGQIELILPDGVEEDVFAG